MDLELSDEQIWLSESVETLLEREAEPGPAVGEPGRVRRRSSVGGEHEPRTASAPSSCA